MLFWVIAFFIIGTLIRIAGERLNSSFIRDTGRLILILGTIIAMFLLFFWFVTECIF